jgi:hypothetical protein
MFTRIVPLLASIVVLSAFTSSFRAEEPGKEAKVEGKHGCFEMRTYTAAEGKMDALNARFRDHTNALFLKHGMTVIGYWTISEGNDAGKKLVYLLAYPDRATRDAMWKAFQDDPDWKTARAESEKDGKLVANVKSEYLTATDYSPIK